MVLVVLLELLEVLILVLVLVVVVLVVVVVVVVVVVEVVELEDELLDEVDHDVVVLPLVVVGSSSVLCRKLRTFPIIGPRTGGFGWEEL